MSQNLTFPYINLFIHSAAAPCKIPDYYRFFNKVQTNLLVL